MTRGGLMRIILTIVAVLFVTSLLVTLAASPLIPPAVLIAHVIWAYLRWTAWLTARGPGG